MIVGLNKTDQTFGKLVILICCCYFLGEGNPVVATPSSIPLQTDKEYEEDKQKMSYIVPTSKTFEDLEKLMSQTRRRRLEWIAAEKPSMAEIFKSFPRYVDYANLVCILLLFFIRNVRRHLKLSVICI